MKTFTAAVIGLGNIGMGYDYSSEDDVVLTHASAYSQHAAYQLVAGVDPDLEKQGLFQEKYSVDAYSSLSEMSLKVRPDVYSVAVPLGLHYDVFCEVIGYGPKAILCEKPIAASIDLALKMLKMASENNVLLFVNYMRRFEPGVHRLKKEIESGVIGDVKKVIIKYSNGFLNCGTHFLDLMQFLFGSVDSISRINNNKSVDRDGDHIDVYCSISGIDIYFVALENCDYHLHEIEFIADRGVVRYYDAGRHITLQTLSKDGNFKDTFTLGKEITTIKNEYHRFQWHVVDALYQALINDEPAVSNQTAALETLRLATNLLD